MHKLLKKLTLFSLPLLGYCAVIAAIDPFNYFNWSNLVSYQTKLKTSFPNNYFLWKCAEFRTSPCPQILLGDSRTASLNAGMIEKVSGEKYYNFAFGGATPSEIVDTFWYATKFVKLKKVFIGMNFDSYNNFNSMNRFPETDAIMKNMLLYLVNKDAVKSSFYNVLTQFAGREVALSNRPHMTQEQFWIEGLEFARISINKKYAYPGRLNGKLKEIKRYCDANGTELAFIMLPTHTDVQERVARFGLNEQSQRFFDDLRSLGKIYNFDYPNTLTRDRDNFGDPYHLKSTDIVVQDVWGRGKPALAKFIAMKQQQL